MPRRKPTGFSPALFVPNRGDRCFLPLGLPAAVLLAVALPFPRGNIRLSMPQTGPGVFAAAAEAGGEKATESEKPKPPLVREITVRGNRRISKGTILRTIRTRLGRPFNPRTWEQDWERLNRTGYFLNIWTYDPEPWPGGVRLRIELEENARVGRLRVKGNKSVKTPMILSTIKTSEGGIYLEGRVHEDKIAIEKLYKRKAFRDVKVKYEVETVADHTAVVGGRERRIADEVQVLFRVDEGRPIGVSRIKFVGNKAFSAGELKKTIATRERRLFRAGDLKDAELETDQKRLEAFYLRHGYMDIKVEPAEVKVSKKNYFNWFRKRKRLAEITFKVNEGPLYHTARVSFKGVKLFEREALEAVMKIKPGSVYSDYLAAEDARRIKALYGERGRVFARININSALVTDPQRLRELKKKGRTSKYLYDVAFVVHEGKEVSLREVITRGNLKTRDKVLIRELNLYPGDRIDTTRIEQAKRALRNLNFFENDVRIDIEPTESPEEADLIIEVAEKTTGEFNFGLGVSGSDSIIGSFQLTQRNFDWRDFPKSWRDFIGGNSFIGAGQRFSIGAVGGANRRRYHVSFFEPWAFDRPLRLGFTAARTVNIYDDYDETENSLSLTAGRRLWSPRWDTDLTYKISLNEIGRISRYFPPILRRHEGAMVLSSLTPRLLYDSRDSRILPSKGLMFQAELELGGGPLLGDVTWAKPQVKTARYFTVYKTRGGGKHILELSGRAALVESFGQTDDPPFFLRFFAGGPSNLRGFKRRTISPRENGFQIGGKKIITATAEYSVPLYEEIVRASLFLDAGSVWDAGKTDPNTRVDNTSGLRATVGFGMAIRTPMSPVPIRFYFARPLIKNDADNPKSFDFTFATRF